MAAKSKNSRKLKNKVPNPDSKKAIEIGYKCLVMDNSYGKGYYGQKDTFVYNSECEIHYKGILN